MSIQNTLQNTFLIFPPEENQLTEVWERWFMTLNPENQDHFSIDEIPADEEIVLLALFGNNLLRQFIQRPNLRASLNNKIIYHLGGISDIDIAELNRMGVKAYLGYKGDAPAFLHTVKEESLFRDAYLEGLKSISRQADLSTAFKATKRAWEELATRKSNSKWNLFVRMYATHNLNHLVLIGDAHWRAQAPPRLISFKESAIRVDRPRIEIVNFSPVLLKWLQEDPAHIAQLSPEKFEDLIADRLTKVGLIVTKTGNTFTPDGGIDLIAYPKFSSVPYLLAAQIKHSHKNRPVSASVVRDFRGAISPLPIDIGMIVTNTSFTPNAAWTAKQLPKMIRLRDLEDLKLWLSDKLNESVILKDFPKVIEIAPGLVIPIPWSIE